jgi:hypothetical protein
MRATSERDERSVEACICTTPYRNLLVSFDRADTESSGSTSASYMNADELPVSLCRRSDLILTGGSTPPGGRLNKEPRASEASRSSSDRNLAKRPTAAQAPRPCLHSSCKLYCPGCCCCQYDESIQARCTSGCTAGLGSLYFSIVSKVSAGGWMYFRGSLRRLAVGWIEIEYDSRPPGNKETGSGVYCRSSRSITAPRRELA